MESVPHGIGVQNRYALFYDEGLDPLEILKQTEEQISKKKTEKPVKGKPAKTATSAPPKKPTESVATKAVKIQEQDNATKPRGKPAMQTKNSNPNDFRENDKNIRNREENFSGGDAREGSEMRRGGRGGGYRGRGGPSRGRGGFFSNNDNRNRRVFDRKSGSDRSGVKPVEKREGAGSNNWGDIRSDMNQRREEGGWDDEFEGEAAPRQEPGNSGDEQGTEFGKSEEVPKNDSLDDSETKENDQTAEEQTPDAKEMTLDEWKKEQEAKRVVPKFNLRKPGEGVDDKQWKKGYVLKKKEVPKEEEDDEEDEESEDEEAARRGHQKVLLDIQFNYADSRRGNRGRGRGGRGGPRSGPRDNANRDSPRDDRPRDGRAPRSSGASKMRSGQQAAPRVDDFNDFPSLVNA